MYVGKNIELPLKASLKCKRKYSAQNIYRLVLLKPKKTKINIS